MNRVLMLLTVTLVLSLSDQAFAAATLESSVFIDGGNIPDKYVSMVILGGQNVSPPLSWSGLPAGAVELALICDDPDGGNWVHWVVYNMSPTLTGLSEGIAKTATVASPALYQGQNEFPGIGYDGPEPPSGNHRYVFTLYVLNANTNLAANSTKAQLVTAMSGKIIEQVTLTGYYYPRTATAPSITAQPSGITVTGGSAINLSVTATGTPTPTYQWYKDGVKISAATSATYTVASAAVGDAGSYSVRVSNIGGIVTSNAAVVIVNAAAGSAPSITSQPQSLARSEGQSATFYVGADGTAPLSYQWHKDGTAISGATSSVYDIASVTAANAGSYTVVVSNASGTVSSAAATLSVTAALALNVTKLQTRLTTKVVTAKVSVNGYLPDLTTFAPEGKQVTVNVGGLQQSFTLDSKGRGENGCCSIAIKTKPSGTNGIGFKLTLANVQAASQWGIDLATAEEVTKTLTVTLTLDGQVYSAAVNIYYKGKPGRGGTVKKQ